MSTVAIIPARGGSRELPGKNLRRLGGTPLIAWTVRAALGAGRIDRTLVSTDDPRIRAAARRAGAEVPFLRPAELARDDTPTAPVIAHAIEWLEAHGERIDVVATLQPTSPLRGSDEIDAVVALLDDPDVRSAVSVALLELPTSVIGRLQAGRLVLWEPRAADPRRQAAAAPAARLTGGVYATRRDLLAEGLLFDERPAAHVVDGGSAIDIDTAADLAAARRTVRSRGRRS